MSQFPSTSSDRLSEPFLLQLARGHIPGHSYINKFGHNPAVVSGGTEEIWDGSATYVFPATALMTKVSQTTDQTALRGETIEVSGLDANYVEVVQNVNLNGAASTTPVVLATPLIRVYRMRILSNVVADSTVRLHNDAENQDYALISVGDQQTEMAIYTVPANKTAYLTQYYANHNPTQGQTFTSNLVKLLRRDNARGYAPMLTHENGIAPDGGFFHTFSPYVKFTEKTDIYLTSTTVAAAADMTGGFDLIIVEEIDA